MPCGVLLLRLRLSEHRHPQTQFGKACKELDHRALRLRVKRVDGVKPWHRRDEVANSEAGKADDEERTL